jgi:hypothetical protein
MLREMAQQMRLLEREKRPPLGLRVGRLANQLEQHADLLEAEIAKGRLH